MQRALNRGNPLLHQLAVYYLMLFSAALGHSPSFFTSQEDDEALQWIDSGIL